MILCAYFVQNINKTPTIAKAPKESKLQSRLAQFISLICNINMMKQQMMEIGDISCSTFLN